MATSSSSSPPDWMASRSTRPVSRRSRRAFSCAGLPEALSRSRSRRASIRRPTPSSWASIARAPPIAPNARRRDFAASPIFSIVPTCSRPIACGSRRTGPRRRCFCPTAISKPRAKRRRPAATSPSGAIRTRSRPICSRWSPAISAISRIRSSPCRARRSRLRSMSSMAARSARITRWTRSSGRWPGTRRLTGANTISTFSTSSPSPISIWARWRTRASTSSTTNTSSRRLRRRPTTTTPISKA